jgi:hypothetical protein
MKEILTLVQLQQEGDRHRPIGGFDLEYSGERFGQDGYRYATMLVRTGAEHEIELPVTTRRSARSPARAPPGQSRGELERASQAGRRRTPAGRLSLARGRRFRLLGRAGDKREQLSEIEESLSLDIDGVRPPEVQAAPSSAHAPAAPWGVQKEGGE